MTIEIFENFGAGACAPWLLISAGLTRGRNSGATWVDQVVVQDGNWVIRRKPDEIHAFNKKMLSVFGACKCLKACAHNA